MGIARIVRGEVRRLREREFAEAAIASGVGRARLVWRHLLPNTVGPVVIAATLNAGTVILLESSLSFLGLGVQPPTPSWGAMVFDARDALQTAWWVAACPAAAITLAAVGFNLVGDGLRDAFNTRTTPG
jgi:peptide/nickel transport system permease protein